MNRRGLDKVCIPVILAFIVALLYDTAGYAASMASYCQTPPFVNTGVKPNVLIILDNSNSFDEDFVGNAVGSYASNSKAVTARKALIDIVNTYSNQMRIGLMAFNLPASSHYNLHNSGYFVSYQPKSYCPNPPDDCNKYCVAGDSTSRAACQSTCQSQNPAFDATYMDEILQLPPGNALRTSYCPLIYPKTIALQNPADPANYMYYKQALPFYDGGNDGVAFIYSPYYSPTTQSNGANQGPYNTYNIYGAKTGTADDENGYSNLWAVWGLVPTDSDVALGYLNFGRRQFWYYVGPTWFANGSPGGGYLHLAIADNDGSNTQKDALLAKLVTNENDPTAYMSCWNTGNPNQCPYVVNSGLTPTTGTFQSATDYFNGANDYQLGTQYTSPIQYRCQKNFIVFVTDGLPSTDQFGNSASALSLLPGVDAKLDNLRCPTLNVSDSTCKFTRNIGGTVYPFDIQTFVLGMGLTDTDKANLNQMAQHGGTAQTEGCTDSKGCAYYADNPAQLQNALALIFNQISQQLSDGTAASILSSSQGSGANILQGVFYPADTVRITSAGQPIKWVGELQNLWYYIDPMLSNSTIREDTNKDYSLDLKQDYILHYYFDGAFTWANRYQDVKGDGGSVQSIVNPPVPFTAVQNLWAAGDKLWRRKVVSTGPESTTLDPRNIYVPLNSASPLTDSSNRFSADNVNALRPLLNTDLSTDATDNITLATNIINYVTGQDYVDGANLKPTTYKTGPTSTATITYRSRTVTANGVTGVWKLGDIVYSTPRAQTSKPLNTYHLPPPDGYGDGSYSNFINSSTYVSHNMAYVGANDGMLHAFRFGTTDELSNVSATRKAQLCEDTNANGICDSSETSTSNLGREYWAFIPRNILPYLQYTADPNYCHLYLADAPSTVFDASIGGSSATDPKPSDGSSWKSVLIGGMGLGGACRSTSSTCTMCVKTPLQDPSTPTQSLGYSTFFALDVTNPVSPSLLWEFYNDSLGFATATPAVVRVGSASKNGNWFAVFASGPTGPIDPSSLQFQGQSDQNMKLFIVDMKTGQLIRTIDTAVANAFAGSLYNTTVDTDRWSPGATGFYQDNAVYVGYTYKDTLAGTWTKGGVGRLMTNEDPDPANWTWSTLIDGIGPVTTAVTKLQDRTNGNLWLYFGTGRYYYKTAATVDDPTNQQAVYGVIDPCYNPSTNTYRPACSGSSYKVSSGSLLSATPSTTSLDTSYYSGWYIPLLAAGSAGAVGCTTCLAERVITDPLAIFSGMVFFTTLVPSTDPCTYGGYTYILAIQYNTGGAPTYEGTTSKAVIQESTGKPSEVTLDPTKSVSNDSRRFYSDVGVPPKGQGLTVISAPKPVQKVLHIKEH